MRPRALALALLATAAVLVPLASPPAARAGTESFVTGATTYTLAPADRAVHVTVDLTFKNTKADTAAVRYYFTGYDIGLQREARNVRATRGRTRLAIKTADRNDYLELDVTFGLRVFHNQTTSFRVQYDLPDAGPRSEGSIRVGGAIAAFYAWSYGADKASVRIVLPPGFEPTTQGDPLEVSSSASGTVLSASAIADRDRWFAWISAERPAALTTTPLSVSIEGQAEQLIVKAFPEDVLWGQTVRDKLTSGVPVLGELIGLPWPVKGPLSVSEAYAPLLGGYAGYYRQGEDGALDEIRITEEPDSLVIIHEASHAWFNGDLFDARWIDEGLANEYASLALVRLGEARQDPEPVQRTDGAAFGLNGWPDPSRIDDQATQDAERYGYNASWQVVRQLVGELGVERMRQVFSAAHDHVMAYAGRPSPETSPLGAAKTDWRELLDLLEQVGGSRQAESLFQTWVITPAQRDDLAAHSKAIAQYAALLDHGHGWLPGYVVRLPLSAWQFPAAQQAMTQADAVLGARDRIDGLAQTLSLTTPDALQRAYEDASIDFTGATALAGREQQALEAIRDARAAVAADHDLLAVIGLLGSTPQAELDGASSAFTAADFDGAQQHASTALATIGEAGAAGQQRVALGGGVVLVVLVVGGGLLVVRRRRGARAPAAMPATKTPRPTHPARGLPYAADTTMTAIDAAVTETWSTGLDAGAEPPTEAWPPASHGASGIAAQDGGAATLAAGPPADEAGPATPSDEREPPPA
ncbi:MAG: hypothetical protein ACXWO7_06190 [Candidatus Limnocylindrales bacterium]